MVKHTQIICRQQLTNYLSVFGHFMELVFKGLIFPAGIRGVFTTLSNIQYGDFAKILLLLEKVPS